MTPRHAGRIRLFAESRTVYPPTILVAYGDSWAENFYHATEYLPNEERRLD